MKKIDVPSWDKFATYIEAWDDFKKRYSGEDNNNDEGIKVNPQTESQIIGKIIDSICNDGESSDEKENNNPAQEKEGETRDQLGEESDGGNDTDALVKGLGFSRAEFLKKWKQISNATHDSVEWRQSHPNPCVKCIKTPCEFANSGTLYCNKCTRNKSVCSVRVDYIADKMGQLYGSRKWVVRAVARNWHKTRRLKRAKRLDDYTTGPGPVPSSVKSSPEKVHELLGKTGYPNSRTNVHVSPFVVETSKPRGYSTLPAKRQGDKSAPSVLEVEDSFQRTHEKWTSGLDLDQERSTFGGDKWTLEHRIATEHDRIVKELESRRHERRQESSSDDNWTTTTNVPSYESETSAPSFPSQRMEAAEERRFLVNFRAIPETLRTRQSVDPKEKNVSKPEMKAVESIAKEKQGLAGGKRKREDEDQTGVARKTKEEKTTPVDAARKRLDTVTAAMGGVEAQSAQGGSGTLHMPSRKDAGETITPHRFGSQLQYSSLYRRTNYPRDMELHGDYAIGVEALEKDNNRLNRPTESMNIESAAGATLIGGKVKELNSTAEGSHTGSPFKPIDSSIAWWRSAALFNQLQINLMEHERFTLSRGLGEYLERLKSLRDRVTTSLALDPLLCHELHVITESLASLHGNEQSCDIRQSRNRLLFPDKHYLESDAEALERQIRRFEEIRHDTRDPEASRSFAWIDLCWQRILDGKSPAPSRKHARWDHDGSGTDDFVPAKRRDRSV